MQSARKDEKIVKTNKIDPWRPEVPTRPRIKKMHEIIITVYVARTLRTHIARTSCTRRAQFRTLHALTTNAACPETVKR